jgi:beta-lactamase class A
VRNRNSNIWLRGISILFTSVAIIITAVSLVGYSRQRNNYPQGMTIAGVPVGGLDPAATAQRLLEVYTSPVEAHYAEAVIQIDPEVIGFDPDVESMLAQADLIRTGGSFWAGYWDYLWNREPPASPVPLRATIEEQRLRAYLQNEIVPRYDLPAMPAQPVPGSTNFTSGAPGQALDIDRAVLLIEDALRSPTNRTVSLSFTQNSVARPTIDNLELLLQQNILVSDFDGLLGLYMADLQTGQEIHFAIDNREEITAEPGLAFTASSTIKIPILVSYFVNRGSEIDEDTNRLLLEVFQKSDNNATDALMARLDENQGPVIVTRDMEAIGLQNTFIGGYFYLGAPNLLPNHGTPANERVDVFTDPDPYTQTTPSEIGTLLSDIYQCAESGGGALSAAFPGRLDAEACQTMIDYMVQDKFGSLIQAGVPDGTLVAHKHGFVRDFADVIHDISDAGIVYTPGGDFILAIYTYHPVQAVWEEVNPLVVQLTQTVYNYFNLPTQ